ncbi:MAG: B12-binding domain-containing radical SAM protein [Deltaproteobacteria bacterium]|nr:B12-binding domain-containing radical SAM protein [Deltaproteobacteria bacterium]
MGTSVALVTPYVFLKEDYVFSPHPGLNQMLKINSQKHYFRRPNVSLLTLASYLDDSYDIHYVDEQYTEIDFSKDYDIVAISIMTVNAYRGYQIADRFREKGCHVIIGGIHTVLAPAEVKEHADTVVTGEGEEAWKQFLADFKAAKPQPFYYGASMNLDESPPPRYDLLPNDFFYSPLFNKEVYSYQYSRGCPHRCNFCASSKAYGKKYRTKSVDHFMTCVDSAAQRAKGDFVLFFADDDITIKRRPAIEMFERMADYPIKWVGCADIAISDDPELMAAMAKANCEVVIVGLESLDGTILEEVDPFKAKYFKNNYGECVNRIQDAGLPIYGSFIVGFDGDTVESYQRIYEFVSKHQIHKSSISMLVPYPQTTIYDQLKAQNRLLYDNYWDKCTGAYPLFKPKDMTIDEMMEGTYWITRKLAEGAENRMLRM